jgi:adenosine deaminase
VQVLDDETPNFQTFLAKFTILRKFYTSREAILRIAYEVVADAAHDNVKYLELRFNPVAQASSQGFKFDDVTDWVIEAVRKAQKDFNIWVRLIIQIGRHEPQFARQLAELAVSRRHKGIVGLDLAGDEEHYSAGKFIDIMRWAKQQGMYITTHAGECKNCSADSIREAVEVIKTDRIGHGVRAMSNVHVLDLLRKKKIPLEMCPTSNMEVVGFSYPAGRDQDSLLKNYPLKDLWDHGLPLTICTDNPGISRTTLSREYLMASKLTDGGLCLWDVLAMIKQAFSHSFLPADEREILLKKADKMIYQQVLARFSNTLQ